jgi:hypothetical protein
VSLHDLGDALEICGEEIADGLRVVLLGSRGVAHQIREDYRDESPFDGACAVGAGITDARRRRCELVGVVRVQSVAALAAEPGPSDARATAAGASALRE